MTNLLSLLTHLSLYRRVPVRGFLGRYRVRVLGCNAAATTFDFVDQKWNRCHSVQARIARSKGRLVNSSGLRYLNRFLSVSIFEPERVVCLLPSSSAMHVDMMSLTF